MPKLTGDYSHMMHYRCSTKTWKEVLSRAVSAGISTSAYIRMIVDQHIASGKPLVLAEKIKRTDLAK